MNNMKNTKHKYTCFYQDISKRIKHILHFTCSDVTGCVLSVLGRNLMDAVTGHVTLLGGDLKVTGIMGSERMKTTLFSFLPSMCLFAF